jgi:tetratricopeptide (TPR) repeat protein
MDRALALKDYTRIIEIDPQSPYVRFLRGRLHYRMGAYEQAVTDLSVALERNPEHAESYRYRALAYGRMGDRDQAQADLARVQGLEDKQQQPKTRQRSPGQAAGPRSRRWTQVQKTLQLRLKQSRFLGIVSCIGIGTSFFSWSAVSSHPSFSDLLLVLLVNSPFIAAGIVGLVVAIKAYRDGTLRLRAWECLSWNGMGLAGTAVVWLSQLGRFTGG